MSHNYSWKKFKNKHNNLNIFYNGVFFILITHSPHPYLFPAPPPKPPRRRTILAWPPPPPAAPAIKMTRSEAPDPP